MFLAWLLVCLICGRVAINIPGCGHFREAEREGESKAGYCVVGKYVKGGMRWWKLSKAGWVLGCGIV